MLCSWYHDWICSMLCSWYHGSISRRNAEQLLRMCREGSYLVRTSESNKLDYSLSVRWVSRTFLSFSLWNGRWLYYVLGLSICAFVPSMHLFLGVHYQTCEHNILKTNEPFFMQIGTDDSWVKGMKWPTLGQGHTALKYVEKIPFGKMSQRLSNIFWRDPALGGRYYCNFPLCRKRSHEAKDRFRDLVEALLTPLGH